MAHRVESDELASRTLLFFLAAPGEQQRADVREALLSDVSWRLRRVSAPERAALRTFATRVLVPRDVVELFADGGEAGKLPLVVNPVFDGRELIQEDDLAFVLMPYTRPWSQGVWRALKRGIAGARLRPLRAKEMRGPVIMEDIWSGILRARIIVADVSGRNPNVYYEVGVAHTVGKQILFVCQPRQRIPFDTSQFRHLRYRPTTKGLARLANELRETLAESAPPATKAQRVIPGARDTSERRRPSRRMTLRSRD